MDFTPVAADDFDASDTGNHRKPVRQGIVDVVVLFLEGGVPRQRQLHDAGGIDVNLLDDRSVRVVGQIPQDLVNLLTYIHCGDIHIHIEIEL